MSDPTDEICNHSSNEHFADVLARSQQAGFSRPQLFRGGVGLAAAVAPEDETLAHSPKGDGSAPRDLVRAQDAIPAVGLARV